MKLILFLLLFFAESKCAIAEHLYVWAKSGLYLRGQPSKEGTKITKINFGEQVEILNEDYVSYSYEEPFLPSINYNGYEFNNYGSEEVVKNSIELNFSGKWILVKYKDYKGFIFDGYLSKFPAFKKLKNGSFENINSYLKYNFSISDSITKIDSISLTTENYVFYKTGILQYSSDLSQKGFESQLVFTNMTFNEAILFVAHGFDLSLYESQEKNSANNNKYIKNYCIENNNLSFLRINYPVPNGEITIRIEGSFTIISVWGSC